MKVCDVAGMMKKSNALTLLLTALLVVSGCSGLDHGGSRVQGEYRPILGVDGRPRVEKIWVRELAPGQYEIIQ